MNTWITDLQVPTCLLPSESDLRGSALNPTARVHLGIRSGKIEHILPAKESIPEGVDNLIAGAGWVGFPGFIDAHVHLDKAHTWNRSPNRSGTFTEALEVLGKDKGNWTEDDLKQRANFALQSAYAYGTGAMRSHVDTGYEGCERTWSVLAETASRWSDKINLQLVSLCGIADYSGSNGEYLADLPLKYGASALGGMPLMSDSLPAELDRLLALAAEREIGLDLHVDESGDPEAQCLHAIAEAVIRNEFPYPVLCGHCCSLALQSPDQQNETMARVKEAGLGIISLPLCNLYLQDRRSGSEFPRSPTWRGLTLLRDFSNVGVPVACASDNVRDAFYAYGDLDMYEVFQYSIRLGHLDSELESAPKVVTTNPAEMMGLRDLGSVEVGKSGDLVLLRGESLSEVLSRPHPERRFIREGLEETRELPAFSDLKSL